MWIWAKSQVLKDRGAWHAAVHGVAKGWTRLSEWTATTNDHYFPDEWMKQRGWGLALPPQNMTGVCGCQALALSPTGVSTFLQLFLKPGAGSTCRAGREQEDHWHFVTGATQPGAAFSTTKKKILSASFSDAALVQPLTCYLTNSVKSWLHCCKNSKACFILVWHIAKNAPEFNTWVFIVMAWISPNHRLINRIRSQTIF